MGTIPADRLQASILLIGLLISHSFVSTAPTRLGAASTMHHQAIYSEPQQGFPSSSASTSPTDYHSSNLLQHERFRVLERKSRDHHAIRRREELEEDLKTARTLRKRLGSRPPMCRDKCETCFPCQAVKMVPTPIVASTAATQHVAHLDYSNYDPEGWKCKCGEHIFNP
ncbi:hypothetical protein L7F22_041444 [Adiantum nelumboides]|nr:hypothetical protein [Adiantum nelumboides]